MSKYRRHFLSSLNRCLKNLSISWCQRRWWWWLDVSAFMIFFFHPFKISVVVLFIDPSFFNFCFRRKSRGKASKGRKWWKSTQTWINLSFINLHANVKFVFDSLSQIMNYPNRWKKILCCPKIDIPFPLVGHHCYVPCLVELIMYSRDIEN